MAEKAEPQTGVVTGSIKIEGPPFTTRGDESSGGICVVEYTGLKYVPAPNIKEGDNKYVDGLFQYYVDHQWYTYVDFGEEKGQSAKFTWADGGGGGKATKKLKTYCIGKYKYGYYKYIQSKGESSKISVKDYVYNENPDEYKSYWVPEDGATNTTEDIKTYYAYESLEDTTETEQVYEDGAYEDAHGNWVVDRDATEEEIKDGSAFQDSEGNWKVTVDASLVDIDVTVYNFQITPTIYKLTPVYSEEPFLDRQPKDEDLEKEFFIPPDFFKTKLNIKKYKIGDEEVEQVRWYFSEGISGAISNWSDVIPYARQWSAWWNQQAVSTPDAWPGAEKSGWGLVMSADGLNEIFSLFTTGSNLMPSNFTSGQRIDLLSLFNEFEANINSG